MSVAISEAGSPKHVQKKQTEQARKQLSSMASTSVPVSKFLS